MCITRCTDRFCCSIVRIQLRVLRDKPRYGGVAQLGEHLPCKQGVKGSNPFISTIKGKTLRDGRTEIPEKNRSVAQVARAHA